MTSAPPAVMLPDTSTVAVVAATKKPSRPMPCRNDGESPSTITPSSSASAFNVTVPVEVWLPTVSMLAVMLPVTSMISALTVRSPTVRSPAITTWSLSPCPSMVRWMLPRSTGPEIVTLSRDRNGIASPWKSALSPRLIVSDSVGSVAMLTVSKVRPAGMLGGIVMPNRLGVMCRPVPSCVISAVSDMLDRSMTRFAASELSLIGSSPA